MADRREVVAWVAGQVMPYEPAVRAWLRRSLVSQDDIDDLIQEAYARLTALEDVRAIERPDGYFFNVVRNLLGDQMRRLRIVRIDAVSEIDKLGLAAEAPSPERATAARRELDRVMQLIGGLPDRCRRIVELRKIEGLSQREIARRLGVTEGTVENDAGKGLRLVLQALRDEGALAADDVPGRGWAEPGEAGRSRRHDGEGGR